MMRISLVGDSQVEVESTLITIDEAGLACWDVKREQSVARYGIDQVLSIHFMPPAPSPAIERKRAVDATHPNAFRRWTEEDEGRVVDAYRRGDSFSDIAASVGRKVGGVRSRLVLLGVIEPEPGDRISFPGSPKLRDRARLLLRDAESGEDSRT